MLEWYIFVVVGAYFTSNYMLKRETLGTRSNQKYAILIAVGAGLVVFAYLKFGTKESFATWGLYFSAASFLTQHLFCLRMIERADRANKE